MDVPPPPSEADLAATPAAVLTFLHWQAEQIARLTARVAELEARLGKTPANSSKPPSSSHPHDKPPARTPRSGRRRGGQPGHARHARPLLPPEQCQRVIPLLPPACRRCGRAL